MFNDLIQFAAVCTRALELCVFATIIFRDEKLFDALAILLAWQVSEFNEESMSNTGWAFASIVHREENL